jgi:hypothetical protein
VVDAYAALATVLGKASVRNRHSCTVLQSRYRSTAARNAAAHHQDIRFD